jgi:hypothetical protein
MHAGAGGFAIQHAPALEPLPHRFLEAPPPRPSPTGNPTSSPTSYRAPK